MQIMPQAIPAIAYPGISSVYKKKNYMSNGGAEDVLVIETNFRDNGHDGESFHSLMTDLLLDLEDIRSEAERHAGPVDRIDIRTS